MAPREGTAAWRSRSDRTPIRVMVEYGCRIPLWGPRGELDEGTLPLSSALVADLRAWQRLFDERHRHETGWRDEESRLRHRREGRGLAKRVQLELGDAYEVELRL